jgi:hypothetical protein
MLNEVQVKVYGWHIPECTAEMPETTFGGDDGTQVVTVPDAPVNFRTVLEDLFAHGFGIDGIFRKMQTPRPKADGTPSQPKKVSVIILKRGLTDHATIPSLEALSANSLYVWVNPSGVATINVARWSRNATPTQELHTDGVNFLVR